jgi:putative ABC transport system substrate-binding protein
MDWGRTGMKQNSSRRFSDFHSNNQKFKIQNRKWAESFIIAFIFVLVGTGAEAQQQKKIHRIGYLSSFDQASESARSAGIWLALRELGYIEGQNIAIEYRYAEGKRERLSEVATELVRLKVDIIVAAGGTGIIQAAKNATTTIPSL